MEFCPWDNFWEDHESYINFLTRIEANRPSEFFQTISLKLGIKQFYICVCESKRVGWKQVSNVVESFELTSE